MTRIACSRKRVYTFVVRLICKVVVGCACLLLAGAPVLACLLPGEERQRPKR